MDQMTRAQVAVAGRYFNQQGGVSNVMAQLAVRAAAEFDISVASAEFLDWDERLTKVPCAMTRSPAWLQTPTFALSARRAVGRGRFDLVHSHDPQFARADLYTAHSCFKRYIGTQRHEASVAGAALSRVYPPHFSRLALERLAYSKSKAPIVAVSGSIKAELVTEYGIPTNRVHIIYNGVDVEKYGGLDRSAARSTLAEVVGRNLEDRLVAIFVGYEFGRKRLDLAIRTIAASKPAKFQLVVAGGADPTAYEALARKLGVAEDVTFLGHRSDVPALLAASDIFLFPTRYEAASLAILEAAAAGLAIVTTDTAMASEVFTDGQDALLVPNVDDPGHATEALRRLASDFELRLRLQSNAAGLAQQFSWDRIWVRYRELYQDLISGRVDARC
jgi:glycosyltransferase involved in cell wall biosynthesis